MTFFTVQQEWVQLWRRILRERDAAMWRSDALWRRIGRERLPVAHHRSKPLPERVPPDEWFDESLNLLKLQLITFEGEGEKTRGVNRQSIESKNKQTILRAPKDLPMF